MTPNEISHYESLKKQDTEHRKIIKKLQLDKQALKEQLIIQRVSNRRELLFDFNEWKNQYEFKYTKPLDIVDMYLEEQGK